MKRWIPFYQEWKIIRDKSTMKASFSIDCIRCNQAEDFDFNAGIENHSFSCVIRFMCHLRVRQ